MGSCNLWFPLNFILCCLPECMLLLSSNAIMLALSMYPEAGMKVCL